MQSQGPDLRFLNESPDGHIGDQLVKNLPWQMLKSEQVRFCLLIITVHA